MFAPVIKLFAGAFFFLLAHSVHAHSLHLSTTSIECEGQNNYVVTVKVFVADLQNVVSNIEDSKQISEYISARLKLMGQKGIISYKFHSYKRDSEAIWYKFLVSNLANRIETVENRLLFELFEDQKNLILFTCKAESDGYKCTMSNPIIEL